MLIEVYGDDESEDLEFEVRGDGKIRWKCGEHSGVLGDKEQWRMQKLLSETLLGLSEKGGQ